MTQFPKKVIYKPVISDRFSLKLTNFYIFSLIETIVLEDRNLQLRDQPARRQLYGILPVLNRNIKCIKNKDILKIYISWLKL